MAVRRSGAEQRRSLSRSGLSYSGHGRAARRRSLDPHLAAAASRAAQAAESERRALCGIALRHRPASGSRYDRADQSMNGGPLTRWFGSARRALNVECGVDCVVVHGLWWNERKIPNDVIVAITGYPTIIYFSPSGRIRRKRIGFLAPSRYADPSNGQRRQLRAQVNQTILSAMRDFRRKAGHLDDRALADRLRLAHAALQWTAKNPQARLDGADSLWSKHVVALETEASRRRGPA